MTHALPIRDLCEESVASAFSLNGADSENPFGGRQGSVAEIADGLNIHHGESVVRDGVEGAVLQTHFDVDEFATQVR